MINQLLNNPYVQLMRLDKPIGIFLLWWPTAIALLLANKPYYPLKLWFIFFLGTILTRSAGCVINDMADFKFDAHVKRTASRPLAAKILSRKQAFIVLLTLLIMSSSLLFFLPISCFYLSFLALIIMSLYPFCKRWIYIPQLILGVAFSMGIPMAYLASNQSLDVMGFYLFIINIIWTIGYDTAYAMTDKHDDINIGVKSTAILLGSYDKFITILLIMAVPLGFLFFYPIAAHKLQFLIGEVISLYLVYQQWDLIYRKNNPFQAFKNNGLLGAIFFLSLL